MTGRRCKFEHETKCHKTHTQRRSGTVRGRHLKLSPLWPFCPAAAAAATDHLADDDDRYRINFLRLDTSSSGSSLVRPSSPKPVVVEFPDIGVRRSPCHPIPPGGLGRYHLIHHVRRAVAAVKPPRDMTGERTQNLIVSRDHCSKKGISFNLISGRDASQKL